MTGTIYNEQDTVWAPADRAVTDEGGVYASVDVAETNANDFVIVGAGTFNETVNVTTDDISIRGAGRATVIDGGDNVGVDVDASNCNFDQFSARTNTGSGSYPFRINNGANGNVSRLVRVIDGGGSGFRVVGDGNLFMGVVVDGSDGIGLDFTGSSTDNHFVGGQVKSGVDSIGVRLGGNRESVTGVAVTGVGSTAIDIQGQDCAVGFCTIDSPGNNGITVDAADFKGGFNTIQNVAGDFVDAVGAPDIPMLLGNTPRSANTAAQSANDVTDTGWVSRLVDSPNGSIVSEPLTNTESAEITVPVADTETLEIYRWGVYQISDGTTPSGLDMQLIDGSGTVQASENTGDAESVDPSAPVASYTNGSGASSVFKIAAYNGTGADIGSPGVGAFAAYRTV